MRRRMRYLNAVLTVNAVLLTGLLWMQIVEQPVLSETAVAEQSNKPGIRVPNAAEQRKKMHDELKLIKRSVDLTRRTLEAGKIKVEVTNLSDFAAAGTEED